MCILKGKPCPIIYKGGMAPGPNVFFGLIDYLMFYVLLKNISLIWRRHHCRWRAAKFRPMLGAQGLWAGRDLYRATPAVTWGLGFSGLIRRTTPFSRLLRHNGVWRIYSNPDPHGVICFLWIILKFDFATFPIPFKEFW
jgi:hypothetical protein